MKELKRILPYLKEHKLKVWIICLGSMVFGMLRLVDPYIYKVIVDEVLLKSFAGNTQPEVIFRIVLWSCLAIFLLRISSSLIQAYYTYLSMEVTSKVEMKMFRDALAHLQSLDMTFHHSRNSGETLEKISRGIDSITNILHGDIAKFFLPSFFNIVCLTVWIFYVEWPLAIAATFFIPFHLYFSLKKAKPIYQEQWEINKAYERIYHRAFEGIYNIEAVTSFTASPQELEQFDRERNPALLRQMKIARWWRVLGFSTSFFEVIGRIAVLFTGTWLVINKQVTPGDIVMFLAYIGMLYQPVMEMITISVAMQQGLSRMQRFFDILDTKPNVYDLPGAVEMPPLKHAIELKNVSFTYDGSDGSSEVIQNVNLTITAGQKIAVVGPTGAGKSTLANLIQRFYDPTAGLIIADGTDLRKITLRSLHQEITIVPQQALLFSRSILENIAYGQENPDEARVREAAKVANASAFIEEKPTKYQTLIGERGIKLSGGEQQRISIARAVLRNASVIIMDEATSHLDSYNESLVQDALWRLIENKTAIIIAHRLSTVQRADAIVVMDDGKVVDFGSHKELIKRCPLYKKLHGLQFQIA